MVIETSHSAGLWNKTVDFTIAITNKEGSIDFMGHKETEILPVTIIFEHYKRVIIENIENNLLSI